MTDPAKRNATYEDLYDIPDGMTGEIINGELIVSPRPARKHVAASSALGAEIIPPYWFGRGGGPGGWIILAEPEIGFGEDILVPDLAGWKKERFPADEPHNWISVPPDWICEILSPETIRKDRVKKMGIYGRHKIPHFWIIDPSAKSLEVFRLESKRWVLLGVYVEDDKVRAEPFQEVEINLETLWL
jgi:Uma2 family endonuclease